MDTGALALEFIVNWSDCVEEALFQIIMSENSKYVKF